MWLWIIGIVSQAILWKYLAFSHKSPLSMSFNLPQSFICLAIFIRPLPAICFRLSIKFSGESRKHQCPSLSNPQNLTTKSDQSLKFVHGFCSPNRLPTIERQRRKYQRLYNISEKLNVFAILSEVLNYRIVDALYTIRYNIVRLQQTT